jgi:hypothetical protein
LKKALHAGADLAKLFVLGDLRNVFERSIFASPYLKIKAARSNLLAAFSLSKIESIRGASEPSCCIWRQECDAFS